MKWFKNIFKRKKSGVPKMENPPPPPSAGDRIPSKGSLCVYLDGIPIATLSNPYPFPVEIQKVTTRGSEASFTFVGLYERDYEYMKWELEQAIESENYEEAARIRDLMNKK